MMNKTDRNFYALITEIGSLSEKELYHRMRTAYSSVPRETRKSCMDFFRQFDYWGQIDEENGNYEEIELKQEALSAHLDDFRGVYERLSDFRSKRTLYSILSNWYRYDFVSTSETREYLFDDYFDHDLLKCGSAEVIADLGAYTGDTALSFFENYGAESCKRMYCYEMTPDTFEILRKNLEPYENVLPRQKAVSDRPGVMYIKQNSVSSSANTLGEAGSREVEVTTLDLDITEPLTIIKADIEGFERKALLGAAKHIKNDRPKLLISVYHNNEDIWKIPEIIDGIRDDYSFYLRYKGSPIYPTEITLFAI